MTGETEVTVGSLLKLVQALTACFTLKQAKLNEMDRATAFYLLFRLIFGMQAKMGQVEELTRSLSIQLSELLNGLVDCRGGIVHILTFDRRPAEAYKKLIEQAKANGLGSLAQVDQVHLVLYLWRKKEIPILANLLARSGFLDEEHPFWWLMQAFLEVERICSGANLLATEPTALAQFIANRRGLAKEANRTNTTGYVQEKLI